MLGVRAAGNTSPPVSHSPPVIRGASGEAFGVDGSRLKRSER